MMPLPLPTRLLLLAMQIKLHLEKLMAKKKEMVDKWDQHWQWLQQSKPAWPSSPVGRAKGARPQERRMAAQQLQQASTCSSSVCLPLELPCSIGLKFGHMDCCGWISRALAGSQVGHHSTAAPLGFLWPGRAE